MSHPTCQGTAGKSPVWGWAFPIRPRAWVGDAKTGLSQTKAPHEGPVARAPHSAQHTRRRQRGLSHQVSLLPTVFIKSHLQSTGRGFGATSAQGMGGHCRARGRGSPPTEAHCQATSEFRWENPQAQSHAPSVQLEPSKEPAASPCAQGWRVSPARKKCAHSGRAAGTPRSSCTQTVRSSDTQCPVCPTGTAPGLGPGLEPFPKHPVRQGTGQRSGTC